MLKSAINKNTPDDYVQRLNDTLINKIWRKGGRAVSLSFQINAKIGELLNWQRTR